MKHWMRFWCVCLFACLSLPANGQKTVKYHHTDALGSVVAVTDASGAVTEQREYEPYGAQLTPVVQDGPGYTGHVQDAATGLVYMQQRYYDPELGKMLSVDPVTAYEKPFTNFCRYCYARNNPYKFSDPDGRDVVYALKGGATLQDQTDTMGYLMTSSTAAGEILQLHHSEQTYTIRFDREASQMGYDADSRTVTVNPTEGLIVRSSGEVQSPAMGAGHEISHAADHDRVGTAAFKNSLETPTSASVTSDGRVQVKVGISPAEAKATGVESKIGRELGEPTRNNYHDQSGTIKTCGAKSNSGC